MIKNVVLLFLAIVLLSSCGSLRRGSSKMDESPYADGAKDDGIEVREDHQPAKEDVQDDQPEIVVREESVKSVDVDDEDDRVFKYYVIIGSFRYIDNARNYKADLIEEGFVPVILENEEGLYRVSVAAYDNEQPARRNIASIRGNYPRYSDVWLLIRKQ